ncbi:hypothetical protein GF362_01115 [Candidatus Dojkabacteria bacterium]|nr:hypothetical protein [Candidatus Dojkabacteria bacterium]
MGTKPNQSNLKKFITKLKKLSYLKKERPNIAKFNKDASFIKRFKTGFTTFLFIIFVISTIYKIEQELRIFTPIYHDLTAKITRSKDKVKGLFTSNVMLNEQNEFDGIYEINIKEGSCNLNNLDIMELNAFPSKEIEVRQRFVSYPNGNTVFINEYGDTSIQFNKNTEGIYGQYKDNLYFNKDGDVVLVKGTFSFTAPNKVNSEVKEIVCIGQYAGHRIAYY